MNALENMNIEGQKEEEKAIVQRIKNWMNLRVYQQYLSCYVEEIDLLIACQYSMKQVVRPARSENCDVACLVELAALEEMGICGCGKEIDEENRIKQDEELGRIIQMICRLYGSSVRKVRVNFSSKQIRAI